MVMTNAIFTGKFRELQRLTVQYARVLDLTEEEEEESSDTMIVES
jgi:protein HIRA/HIR1